jgi:hypothetical protein
MRVEARCATQCATVDAASSSAGQTIPLTWRLTDARGAAVTTLENADLFVVELGCAPGSSAVGREVEGEVSEVTNLGDGDYQLDWKTPASFAGSCRRVQLDLFEGSTAIPYFHTADFRFRK